MKISKIIFIMIFFICSIFAFTLQKAPETNFLAAFFSNNSKDSMIVKLSKISNNKLNIIFESDDIDSLNELKSELEPCLKSFDYAETVDVYKNYPKNFLSQKTFDLLKNKDYATISDNSLKLLYNPLGIYIAPVEKDPYLFATDFILSLQNSLNLENIEYKGKFYSLVQVDCTDNDIKKIKEKADELNKTAQGTIYLSGSPIHAYTTQQKSNIEINIICILSIILISIMSLCLLKTFKILLPIALSIIFGLLFGMDFSILFFHKLHILTFVFATSLIGVSLDYSLHYYLSSKDSKFKKSLLTSFLSTAVAFSILYFSNIELLKQIAVFSAFGLFGVYLFVTQILPMLNIELKPIELPQIKFQKFKKPIVIISIIIIFAGISNLKFDDSIKNLYKPIEPLRKAETLYKNVFGINRSDFIIVKGETIDNILNKTEQIKDELLNNNITSFSLADFVSSTDRQKENISLINELYKNDLNNYATFLTDEQKENLLKEDNIFDPSEFPINNEFLLDDNTSFILTTGTVQGCNSINIANAAGEKIREFRHVCLYLSIFIFFFLFVLLKLFYKLSDTLKLLLPSFLGGLVSISLVGIFSAINVFHILAFILSLGFSLDYSIFRLQGGKNSSLAVLISVSSTALSFLMLSFTSFKLISSLGLVLSLGIISSYILSLSLISKCDTENI